MKKKVKKSSKHKKSASKGKKAMKKVSKKGGMANKKMSGKKAHEKHNHEKRERGKKGIEVIEKARKMGHIGVEKEHHKVKALGANGYLKLGIKGFDALFEKGYGIPYGASVLVEGGPGSGKTIFSLATLVSLCEQGKKCLFMSFEEPEEQLLSHMKKFGWDAEKYVKKGLLRIKRFDAIDISRSVEALLSEAKKELLIEVDPVFFPPDFEPDFVAVDSLTSIASAFSGQESRFRIYMEQLFRYLEKHDITSFLVREVATPTHVGSTYREQGEAVSFLSDGIIIIYNVMYDNGERGSALEILKMRGSNFKRRIVEMEIINKKGFIIHPEKIMKIRDHKSFKFT